VNPKEESISAIDVKRTDENPCNAAIDPSPFFLYDKARSLVTPPCGSFDFCRSIPLSRFGSK
jgi:hypothetical protein